MKLSCVILTMGDRPAELDRAVRSALAQRDAGLEVIVVGNGAGVAAPAGASVLRLPENVGVAAGRNAGAAAPAGMCSCSCAYLLDWFVVTVLRERSAQAVRAWVRGFAEGWRMDPGERRPLSARTVWRMTRAGRPPVI